MKLLFITSGMFSVPNVEGGSVETLLTHFIDMNEIYGKAEVTVACKYNDTAVSLAKKYKKTSFLYYSKMNAVFPILVWRVLRYRFWGLFNKPVAKYLYSQQVLDYAQRQNFDWIIVEEGDCYSFDIFAKVFGRDHMVAHTHSSWPANAKYHSIYGYGIVPSQYTKNTLINKQWKDYENNVGVVQNCVSEKQFQNHYTIAEKSKLRKQLGIQNQYVILYAGRVDRNKGIKELILAMDQLPNAKLILAGSALLSHKTNNTFEKEISSMVNSRNNIIQTGYIPYEEIARYYSITDVIVTPGYAGDSCCLVNLEAMMMGIPVISSIDGGIPEYITDGRDGFLVNTASITEEIVKYVRELQSHPEEALKFSENCLIDSKKFCRKAYYDSMMRFFQTARTN